jgi:hypothetical protein
MTSRMNRIILLLIFFFSTPIPCRADSLNHYDTVVFTSEFQYRFGRGDSNAKGRALALFGAKLKAVVFSAKYLMHKDLLVHYGKKENEIFCLATREIYTEIIDEKIQKTPKAYYVKIKTETDNTDFIKAEIKNLELEKEELKLSYAAEMEQPVIKVIDPGLEISRAFRHISKRQWRPAIIYLDHLGKKYPNWGEIYLAKAIAFYGQDEIENMKEALKTACLLNNQEACSDFQIISRSQKEEFKFE